MKGKLLAGGAVMILIIGGVIGFYEYREYQRVFNEDVIRNPIYAFGWIRFYIRKDGQSITYKSTQPDPKSLHPLWADLSNLPVGEDYAILRPIDWYPGHNDGFMDLRIRMNTRLQSRVVEAYKGPYDIGRGRTNPGYWHEIKSDFQWSRVVWDREPGDLKEHLP